ncbi:MAG: nicotinate-nucleotide adenylyltransferase [Alphaproteobacteria bacterium]
MPESVQSHETTATEKPERRVGAPTSRDIYALSRISGRRIGLLGGSFNPAHEGHRHISLLALRYLNLHEVWWVVSPQNPLKPADGMASFEERFEFARKVARHPRIRVSDIEVQLGTRFTLDTLRRLQQRCQRTRLVWLMGADNLAQIPKWRNWNLIFETVPVAVFARPSYSMLALAGKAAHRYARIRLPSRSAASLANMTPPAWTFFHSRLHQASSTQIRAQRRAAESATKA